MASGALFGGSTSRSGGSKNLVEFKAGKMTIKGKTVTADKRKGFLYVFQSDDELMHLCWRERQKTTAEDDLIIFPDDIEYKAVPQCTSGRVFLLKFKSTNRKNFFWMQESNADNDEDLWSKLNTTLNNPPSASSSSSRNDLLPELASLGEGADIQNLLGNMDAQQMLRLLTGNVADILNNGGSSSNRSTPLSIPEISGSSRVTTASMTTTTTTSAAISSTATTTTAKTTTAPATTTTAATTSAAVSTTAASGSHFTPIIQLSDLQNILSNFKNSETASGIEDYDIVKAISPELLLPLLADSKIQERLMEFLPEGNTIPKSVDELRNTVHSPQFQQTLRSFSSALLSGQLGPLISQFNLGDEAVKAAEKGDVLAFAKALQKDTDKPDE